MSSPGEVYLKEISIIYDNIPDKVEFYDQQFSVHKT